MPPMPRGSTRMHVSDFLRTGPSAAQAPTGVAAGSDLAGSSLAPPHCTSSSSGALPANRRHVHLSDQLHDNQSQLQGKGNDRLRVNLVGKGNLAGQAQGSLGVQPHDSRGDQLQANLVGLVAGCPTGRLHDSLSDQRQDSRRDLLHDNITGLGMENLTGQVHGDLTGQLHVNLKDQVHD